MVAWVGDLDSRPAGILRAAGQTGAVGTTKSYIMIEEGMLKGREEPSDLTPTDYEPGPCVRIIFEQMAKQQ